MLLVDSNMLNPRLWHENMILQQNEMGSKSDHGYYWSKLDLFFRIYLYLCHYPYLIVGRRTCQT